MILPQEKIFENSMFKVKFLNKNGNKIDEFSIRKGTNLWVFIRKRGLPIGAACSGVGVCAACHLKVVEGTPGATSEQNEFERNTLKNNNKHPSDRLACLCRVYGDITVQADYW